MGIDINQANEGLRANARGGIAAAIAVNSGAMIALLSQLGALRDLVDIDGIKLTFAFWIAGATLGMLAWFFATLAASAHANARPITEKSRTIFGYLVWLSSVSCFAVGAINVLFALK